jgi:hypothetical protein
MSQSEEVPADQPIEPTQPIEQSQTTEPTQPIEVAARTAEPTQPVQPAPAWAQPEGAATAATAEAGVVLTAVPPTPEELAAAEAKAAKKSKRRMVFAKTAVLAVPALALVGLLIVTGSEANKLTTQTTAASNAAKTATSAEGLVAQLRLAESAGQASILVDAGCVAAESQATAGYENKLITDGESLAKAANGTSLSAFTDAANRYIDDVQALQTNLQQDAALSTRASVKSTIGAVTSDLGTMVSTLQDELDGSDSTSAENNYSAAAGRMDGDATAVDTMCGGTTLQDGSSSSGGNSGNGNGSTAA